MLFCLPIVPLLASCGLLLDVTGVPLNPYRDLPTIPMDGEPHALEYDIAPLGQLDVGDVVRLQVSGAAVDSLMILTEDAAHDEAGVLAGGGPANVFLDYRVQVAGRYFVHVLFDPSTNPADRWATLTAMPGPATYHPPSQQVVLVVFEDGYLTEPGLVDPDSFTADERQLLADLSDVVRTGVIDRLRVIFDGTPIEILTEDEPLPASPYARLVFTARRKTPSPGETWEVTTGEGTWSGPLDALVRKRITVTVSTGGLNFRVTVQCRKSGLSAEIDGPYTGPGSPSYHCEMVKVPPGP